jgi:hypothetical protein
MKYRKVLSRRTLLRGTGTIAIGLPFLDEMSVNSAWGAPADPPQRVIDVFFGEGMPNHVQDDHLAGMTGPLEPLRALRPKLGFVRGLGFPEMGGAHESGALCSFVGARFRSKSQSGGPSVDQVMMQELYPQGQPAGMIPTLAMGFYGSYREREEHWRRVKSWKNDGSPSDIPKAYPADLFKRIFGSNPDLSGAGKADAERKLRLKKSVLDSVVSQYKSLAGESGGLGKASRARIGDHVERLREYEQRVFAMPPSATPVCQKPGEKADPPLFRGQTPFNGVNLTVEDITIHWRLLADLFVMGYQCNLTRVGIASFLNVGDRIDVRGKYEYEGRMIYEFNDSRDRPGSPENEAVNHEHFHAWDKRGNRIAEHHLHFYMRELAYLLTKLDDPQFKDENGKTLLENAMVMITTELSEPGAHSVVGVIHMLGSGNGRFKTGGNITRAGDGRRPAADLYNTILRSYGIMNRTMAPTEFKGLIPEIRA